MSVNGLSGSQYGISVFMLENQIPFPRVVTSPKTVTVADSDQGLKTAYACTERHTCKIMTAEMTQSSSIEYKFQATSTGVCISCTFLDSSSTDCLVLVHQPVSQLRSSRLMNIKSSHRFTRFQTNNTAYGCIEGVNQSQYQIGVPDGKMIAEPNGKISTCSVQCI